MAKPLEDNSEGFVVFNDWFLSQNACRTGVRRSQEGSLAGFHDFYLVAIRVVYEVEHVIYGACFGPELQAFGLPLVAEFGQVGHREREVEDIFREVKVLGVRLITEFQLGVVSGQFYVCEFVSGWRCCFSDFLEPEGLDIESKGFFDIPHPYAAVQEIWLEVWHVLILL